MSDRAWSRVTADTPIQEYFPDGPPDTVGRYLTSIADHFKTDKGNIKHRYTEHYGQYFTKMAPARLLEIGVGNGCSLKMWSAWAPELDVHGLDIRPECAKLCKGWDNITIHTGDATKTKIDGPWDIIIDDGSHQPENMAATLRLYWDSLNPGGFYCIEDFKPTYGKRDKLVPMLDGLMGNVDLGDIEYLHYYRELMIIRKASKLDGK